MTFDINPDDLYVNCTMQDQTPLVMWAYQGQQGTLTISEARNRAEFLLTAAAIATNEAAIVQGLKAIAPPQPKGFGKKSPSKEQQQADEIAGQMLMLIRQYRPPLPEAIEVIYGHYTQQPLVVIHEAWYGSDISYWLAYPTLIARQYSAGFQVFGYSFHWLGNPYRLHERCLDST